MAAAEMGVGAARGALEDVLEVRSASCCLACVVSVELAKRQRTLAKQLSADFEGGGANAPIPVLTASSASHDATDRARVELAAEASATRAVTVLFVTGFVTTM